MIVYFKLCKAGYARSVKEAAELDARTVIQALKYEEFCYDYERTYVEINRDGD